METTKPERTGPFIITHCNKCNRIGERTEAKPHIDATCRYCGGTVTRNNVPDERSLKKILRIHRHARPVNYSHDYDKSKAKKPVIPMR